MAETKEKLIRVLQLIQETDEKSPMNAQQIKDALSRRFNIENVDRRSIYRDIALLETCGYKITQCKSKRKGWFLKERPFDEWEIKLMIDAIMQAKCITKTDADNIKRKLLALSSVRGRKRFGSMIWIRNTNKSVDKFAKNYIELMMEAMFQKRKIEFQYIEITDNMQDKLRKEGKFYKLNLYTMWWSGDTIYLIGAHDNHEGLSNYRLDRMRNLRISTEVAIDAEEKIGKNSEQKIQDYIADSVNHYAGKVITLILEYEPTAVNNGILYDFAGQKIRVQKVSERCNRATIRKMNSVTLIGWLLQYADRFKVIAPENVRNNIIEKLNEALTKYSE